MAPSIWQILIVLVLIVLLFGRGKISDLMGDVAKGIKSFQKGMKDDEQADRQPPAEPRTIDNESAQPAEHANVSRKQETPST